MTNQIHCAIHDELENPGVVSCFECSHQYQSRQEILDTYNENIIKRVYERNGLPQTFKATSMGQVGFCPLCLHDW